MDCELCYRFAAYDGTRTPQHVFAVMIINGEEIWIDPVLDYFNEDKQPNYYKDKKIHNMALMALSGVDPYKNIQTAETRSGLAGFNFSNISSLVTGASSGGGNILNSPVASSVLKALPGGDAVAQILPLLNSFFGAKRGAAGTEYGAKKYLQMYPDVAAAGYEPWAHYQENGWREGRYWFENPSVTKEVVDDYLTRYPDVRNSWDNSVLQHYLEYGKNEGRTIKLNLTSAQAEAINKATGSGGGSFGPGGFGPTYSGGESMGPGGFEQGGSTGTKTAGISPLIILAIVGAGAAMFLSKKK